MIKLSKLTTDEFLDKVCDLTPHILTLSQDKKMVSIFSEKVEKTAEMSASQVQELAIEKATEKISKLIPMILKKHRKSVLNILATMSDRTAEEVAKQNAVKTIMEIKQLIQDEDLKQLFLELSV